MDLETLSEIGKSRANNKSDLIRDGKGVLMVEELIYEKMNEGKTWVSRLQVVSSESKGDLDAAGKPILPNAPGSHVGWVQKTEKFKSAAGNVKAFVLELLGFSETEVDANVGSFGAATGELLSPAQPARGMLIGYETYRQTTKSGVRAGQVNTYVRFMHIKDGNDPNNIAARRAQLDKDAPLAKK